MEAGVQAIFLHRRLLTEAAGEDLRQRLDGELGQRKRAAYASDSLWWVGPFENVVVELMKTAPELAVEVLRGSGQRGQLVTLTQNFYFKKRDEDSGTFRTGLATDRDIVLRGRFSTEHLLGTTGKTTIWGQESLSALAYVGETDLDGSDPSIELRPLFFGWTVLRPHGVLPTAQPARPEVFPQQLDQFADIAGRRSTAKARKAVAKMPEDDVIAAFAEILGEPFVPGHAPNETSDLYTSRATIDGAPVPAAFAFKGPGQPGKLHIANMGKRGDQAMRLVQEPADLIVVQHHDAVVAAVRNLLGALGRAHNKRYMVIDGETTAVILETYGHLK